MANAERKNWMKYNFDRIIDRNGTNSLKYDFKAEHGKPEDVLPLWVADMDFQVAPEILEKLSAAVEHGIFGYSEGKDAYFQAVAGWYERQFDWEVKEDWLVKTPGVVFAISAAIRAYTREGEAVLLQQPVYYPFRQMIKENGRIPVNSPLLLEDGRYRMDFADLEDKIKTNKVKLFLLCSPHNPVGRVWEEEELRRLGEICLRHDVIVVSDEIHSDFVRQGYRHHMFASLSPAFADITVTCTSPSKTFNLAGLQVSNIFISNAGLRRRFQKAVSQTGYCEVNLMGLTACQAAYESAESWLAALKEYLEQNLSFVRAYLREQLPEIRLIEPEGTYLVWLDFSGLGMTEEEREALIVKEARLWLDSGVIFGPEGEGFERVNIACPRQTLALALDRLRDALRKRTAADKAEC